MREKISIYVEGLFSDAALTIRNAEVLCSMRSTGTTI